MESGIWRLLTYEWRYGRCYLDVSCGLLWDVLRHVIDGRNGFNRTYIWWTVSDHSFQKPFGIEY